MEEREVPAEPRRCEAVALLPAFHITYKDLEEHVFAAGCHQCEFNELHQKSGGGVTYLEDCRQRMLDAFVFNSHGRRRLTMYEGRVDQAIADRGPAYDWTASSGPRVTNSDGQPRRKLTSQDASSTGLVQPTRVGVRGAPAISFDLPSGTQGSRHTTCPT